MIINPSTDIPAESMLALFQESGIETEIFLYQNIFKIEEHFNIANAGIWKILNILQIWLESLPNIKRLIQSDTTNALVRQLTCLLYNAL